MRKFFALATLLISLNISALAQYQPVFPSRSGQELLDSLVKYYKAPVLLSQAFARDTLFAKIYAYHDSLTCVYTGDRIYLNPAKDPTQDAFDKGFNTEHTFPQSLGAMNQAEGDMHHLYPTRVDVNADRGNLPFAEIPDAQTDDWYYLGQQLSNPPSTNINLYSERKDGFFEPREDHKGNVARAMFYFYTMYKAQADAEDPDYFDSQRQTLCAWHLLDPVSEPEWNRTWLIAQHQSDKPNPFVLDCTLPERCYCADFGTKCTPAATEEGADNQSFKFESISPNPLQDLAVLRFTMPAAGRVRLSVFGAFGNKLEEVDLGWMGVGRQEAVWQRPMDIASGMCFFRLEFEGAYMVKKAIILPMF